MATKPSDIERVGHMVVSIKKIFRYTKALSLDDFLKNDLVQDAVVKNFEVIGEAAYHLTSDLKDKYNHIEWSKIQRLRHILVHDYYQINPEILWDTKEQHLHNLLADLEILLDRESTVN